MFFNVAIMEIRDLRKDIKCLEHVERRINFEHFVATDNVDGKIRDHKYQVSCPLHIIWTNTTDLTPH